LIVWGDIDSPEVIVKQLEPRLAEILVEGATARLGVGSAKRTRDGAGAVVFALQSSGVSTAPIPRVAEAGSTVTVDAVVDAHYRDPEVFVTRGDGSTQRLELRAGRPGGFTAQVACVQHGRQQIEITASDQLGSTVLANFPVWCADTPPVSVTVDPARDDVPAQSPEEAERRLLAAVNRDRTATGLTALIADPRLEAVARGYAEEMRRTRVVAHVSPTSGSASERLRAANVHSGVVLENVARAYGVNEAHQGLMNSPGHRANIMSSMATHIGIGVAFGDEISGRREIFITQVFTRVPPKIDPVKAVESVRQKLASVQRPLAPAMVLHGPAQQFADALASGRSRDEAY
ncbi:MAG: CAP domain-containing protein, partial [Solirubrobacteraceae bacterium]